MRKGSSGTSLDLGPFPGRKGWNSERVRTVNPNGGGRTLGSKWEDAERWICSPSLGLGDDRSKYVDSHGQKIRRPKSKSGPIAPPGALYYSNNSPTNPGFEGGSLRNFVIGSPFSTGVLAADSVCLNYGGMERSSSLLGMSELQNENLDDSSNSEDSTTGPAVSQRDVATQISPKLKGCPQSSPRNTASFAPSSPTLVSIVEQQREHFAKLEVREVQMDPRVTVVKESRNGSSNTKKNPPVTNFGRIAFQEQASPAYNIAEEAMNISRLQREEARITAWENLQKAKAEASLRKLEMKLERKRSSTMDKITKKLRKGQVKANKMRSSMAAGEGHQVPQSKVCCFYNGLRMCSLRGCFTCKSS